MVTVCGLVGYALGRILVGSNVVPYLMWSIVLDVSRSNRKDHRNGIKKPKKHRFMSMKGVDQKFLRNLRFAKKHNKRNHHHQQQKQQQQEQQQSEA
uniref:60S ribosomal protein L29 n=1 Tax=Setaria digitata TaxID=48799 RepID=A0A915PME0_9BILA